MSFDQRQFAMYLTAFLTIARLGIEGQNLSPKLVAEHTSIVIVELFTSEGCSSCPAADALLSRVNGTRTGSGQLIVGISEHVTYWNSLGWTDPYSAEIYTARQNAYARRFDLGSVYTPEMIVNGAEQFVGSDQAALALAIKHQSKRPDSVVLHISSTHVTGSVLSVSFSAEGPIPPGGADVVAVLVDDADRSSVLHGENAGRSLAHVAVARSLQRVTPLPAGNGQTVQVLLPPAFQSGRGHHLILFAQSPNYGRILSADIAPL